MDAEGGAKGHKKSGFVFLQNRREGSAFYAGRRDYARRREKRAALRPERR